MARLAPNISLTTSEKKLFLLLKEVSQQSKPPVVCRVAGGWVRDKLLGHSTNDLDIALDSVMGIQFAKSLSSFLRKPENTHRFSSSDSIQPLVTHIGKIKANPSKSKHLETAACHVLGFSLDFVNLRSESYNEHSRIPEEMKFGTPLEDALRRDCTINSLFFNISTEQIEDFTEKGLLDLDNKLIRTPLSPKTTFQDDPLRVLRSIRFASRFQFRLDDDLKASAKDPDILKSLATKISKERIGEEITKMLNGPSPTYALSLLHDLDILKHLILASPIPPKGNEAHVASWKWAEDAFAAVPRASALFEWVWAQRTTLFTGFFQEKQSYPALAVHVCMLVFPFLARVRQPETAEFKAPAYLQACFKWRNVETQWVSAVASEMARIVGFPDSEPHAAHFPGNPRVELGLLVRSLGRVPPLRDQYPAVLLLALVFELLPLAQPDAAKEHAAAFSWDRTPLGALTVQPQGDKLSNHTVVQKYRRIFNDIQQLGLADAWDWAPLCNGTVLCERLGLSAGPRLKYLLDAQLEWQLAQPVASEVSVEAALDWLAALPMDMRADPPPQDRMSRSALKRKARE